jgi:hypothetical protein|tara:strand:+ start:2363 stop:2755 length:393 start_codon:yes stop_codon:yes gene_type:complete
MMSIVIHYLYHHNNGGAMPKLRECRECGDDFDPNSEWKREVKGYINVCPWCTEEMGGDPAPEIRGFSTGSGKMQDISFVRFEDRHTANQYRRAWNACSGGGAIRHGHRLNKIKYEHVGHNAGNPNHKGKA